MSSTHVLHNAFLPVVPNDQHNEILIVGKLQLLVAHQMRGQFHYVPWRNIHICCAKTFRLQLADNVSHAHRNYFVCLRNKRVVSRSAILSTCQASNRAFSIAITDQYEKGPFIHCGM